MTTEKLDLTGAQEVEANWQKFTVVGDACKGTLINTKFQKSNIPGYQDQWIFQLKKENGEIWNVGVSVGKTGTIDRLQKCKEGEIIAIVLDSIGEPKKGMKAPKNLKVYSFGMDTNYHADGAEIDLEKIEL